MNKKLKRAGLLLLVVSALILVIAAPVYAAGNGDAGVMLNDKILSFAQDSLPKNVNGRIMVPYRAIFEELGLEVSYDAATKEISGKTDAFTLTMKNQDPVIKLTYTDGNEETKTMDVAPFVESGRTFVPTRFVSEMLGYNVGWDGDNKTVVIVDSDTIIGNADEDFSILMKLMDVKQDPNKAYSINGTVDMNMGLAAEKDGKVNESGTFTGTVEGNKLDMSMDLKVKSGTESAENVTSKVKVDCDTGNIYIQADEVTEKGQWLQLNLQSLSDMIGFDLQDLLDKSVKGEYSIADALSTILQMGSDSYTTETYKEIKQLYDIMKGAVGNQAFKEENGVYTSSFSGNYDTMAYSGKVVIKTDASGKATGYDITVSCKDEDVSLAVAASGTATASKLDMDFAQDGTTVKMVTDVTLKETTNHPDVSIPAGDSVVDVAELMKQFAALFAA